MWSRKAIAPILSYEDDFQNTQGATFFFVVTDRLYYRDSYLSSFRARVVDSAEGRRRVYLDRTAFYPTSGGQPHDTGTLQGIRILDTVDEDDRIAHIMDRGITADEVEGHIDWPRRYDHMQQHTGQHVLSAVFIELFDVRTVSFHMGAEVSTIELATSELTDFQIDLVEQRANEIVREARSVGVAFEDAANAEGLRKASSRSGTLRIIEIANLDRSACGGTHVRSTAELGPIQIRKAEKIRGNVRIDFVCGIRALRRARCDFRIALELSRQAAVPIDKLPENFATWRQRLTEAEKERQRLTIELARREGESLWLEGAPSPDGLRRILIRVSAVDESSRVKAQAFTARNAAIALVIGSQPAGVIVACSPDSGKNAGAILKEALAGTGGRGGGSSTMAQGSLPDPSVAEKLQRALGFEGAA